MLQILERDRQLFRFFLSFLIARDVRMQEDLLDRLLHSSEQRLARILLLLAGLSDSDRQEVEIPKVSQEILAEIVGTTRSRVNFFMNKFRDLGFIEYNGDIRVKSALLTVVLHD